jgi:ribosome-associated heat shock protein Hsp15
MSDPEADAKLRVDKWLWYARVVKTRTLAANTVKAGKVRVNHDKISSPSRNLAPGDVLTVTLERQIKVLKILALGSGRGPASEAQQLYEDLSPEPTKTDRFTRPLKQAVREEGAGRPTKKQRRELSRFRSQAGDEY